MGGGGGTKKQPNNWSDLAGDEGGVGGRRGAREAGKGGGRWGQQRAEVESVDKMWRPLKTYGRVGGPGLEKEEG